MIQEKTLTGYPSIDKPWLKYYKSEDLSFQVPKCKIYDHMKAKTADFAGNVALDYYGVKVTYKKMHERIESVAKSLQVLGVQSGEIVSVCLPNTPEVVYVFYAINRVGAVANMLDPRSSEESLERALADAKSKVLITLELVKEKFRKIRSNTQIEHFISVSVLESVPLPFKLSSIGKRKKKKDVISWKKFVNLGKTYTGIIDSVYVEDVPAVIAYTGGTTGEPKGVIATNENLNSIIAMNEKIGFNVSPGERSLNIAPPWTYYGLNNCLNAFLCMGQQVIMIPKIGPDELGEVVNKQKPNHIITVPSALVAVMNHGKLKKSDLSYLKTIIVGADKLDETFEEQFNMFLKDHNSKAVLTKGYGMTELTAAATYTKDNCNGIGSVGIPYIGNTVAIFETDTWPEKELLLGERGEIAITGPSVTKGYFGTFCAENESIIKLHSDGRIWVHTGDIGHLDKNGKLYIDGRIKRMFVKNGFKVFPGEIERQIMKHDAVRNCAVVSIEDKNSGNAIKAFVVLKEEIDQKRVSEELHLLLREGLYDYEVPEQIEFIGALPLTGMGKVDYQMLEKLQ